MATKTATQVAPVDTGFEPDFGLDLVQRIVPEYLTPEQASGKLADAPLPGYLSEITDAQTIGQFINFVKDANGTVLEVIINPLPVNKKAKVQIGSWSMARQAIYAAGSLATGQYKEATTTVHILHYNPESAMVPRVGAKLVRKKWTYFTYHLGRGLQPDRMPMHMIAEQKHALISAILHGQTVTCSINRVNQALVAKIAEQHETLSFVEAIQAIEKAINESRTNAAQYAAANPVKWTSFAEPDNQKVPKLGGGELDLRDHPDDVIEYSVENDPRRKRIKLSSDEPRAIRYAMYEAGLGAFDFQVITNQ